MRLKIIAAAALLATAGCTPMEWVKADVTPEEMSRDVAQCHDEAWREAQFRTWPSRGYGYGRRRFGGPWSNDAFFEESRLADFCMRVKGYELVPAEGG